MENEVKKKRKTKAVICLNTNQRFESVQEVMEYLNESKMNVFKVCSGHSKTLGWSDELKEPLQWAYEKDVMSGERMYQKGLESFKSVICVTTGEVFEKIVYASKAKGISQENIRANCEGRSERAGIDEKTKKPLVWRYWQEYRQKEEKENVEYEYAVISLLTKEVFGTYAEAEKARGLSKGSISRVINKVKKGEYSSTKHKEKNQKEVWMSYSDYLKVKDLRKVVNSLNKTKRKKRKVNTPKIICLPLKKKFSSVQKAADYFELCPNMIYRSLRASKQGIERKGGKTNNGQDLYWVFEEDYVKEKEKKTIKKLS